jgi:hypothetical protein
MSARGDVDRLLRFLLASAIAIIAAIAIRQGYSASGALSDAYRSLDGSGRLRLAIAEALGFVGGLFLVVLSFMVSVADPSQQIMAAGVCLAGIFVLLLPFRALSTLWRAHLFDRVSARILRSAIRGQPPIVAPAPRIARGIPATLPQIRLRLIWALLFEGAALVVLALSGEDVSGEVQGAIVVVAAFAGVLVPDAQAWRRRRRLPADDGSPSDNQ